MRGSSLSVVAAAALFVSSCGGEPPKRPRDPGIQEDPWSAAPKTAEWLYVTRDFSGKHDAECREVLGWIDGEEKCSSTLCAHGAALAKDWLSRCADLVPDAVDRVKERHAKMKKRAAGDATPCASEAEAWLREGCSGATCKDDVQAWATRCGNGDGSPLVLRMLERAVERVTGARETIDARGCPALLASAVDGAKCAQMFQCEDALKIMTTYRARCDASEGPSLLSAVVEMAIRKGAQQPAAPIGNVHGSVRPQEWGTALDDGTGAAIAVCDERVFDLASYVAKRKTCEGGRVSFAKAFKRGGETKVFFGELATPNDATFAARFPSLVLHGEAELRDAQAFAAFDAALAKVEKESDAKAAAIALARAVAQNARALARSKPFREALAAHDAALVPAMRELGKAKVVAAKKRMSSADLVGYVSRAQTRVFADVSPEGAVEPGAVSSASELDATEILPASSAAYAAALKPALALVRIRKIDKKTAQLGARYGAEQANACGTAEKAVNDAENALLACAFGVESCDPTKVDELAKSLDDARKKAEAARHQLDLAMTGPAASSRASLVEAATTAGCLEPWW